MRYAALQYPSVARKESGMPLTEPAKRERLHTRSIEINGYRRADGHYDIEVTEVSEELRP